MTTALDDKELLSTQDSDEDFITKVYRSELDREPDGEGFKYWLDDLNLRGETREQVLANIRRSEEYKEKHS
jgi:hypothetical protein